MITGLSLRSKPICVLLDSHKKCNSGPSNRSTGGKGQGWVFRKQVVDWLCRGDWVATGTGLPWVLLSMPAAVLRFATTSYANLLSSAPAGGRPLITECHRQPPSGQPACPPGRLDDIPLHKTNIDAHDTHVYKPGSIPLVSKLESSKHSERDLASLLRWSGNVDGLRWNVTSF